MYINHTDCIKTIINMNKKIESGSYTRGNKIKSGARTISDYILHIFALVECYVTQNGKYGEARQYRCKGI